MQMRYKQHDKSILPTDWVVYKLYACHDVIGDMVYRYLFYVLYTFFSFSYIPFVILPEGAFWYASIVQGGPLWANQFGNTHGLVQTTSTIEVARLQ